MKYRKLGKTNLRVSVVGVGTWQFGGEWGHDYTPREADDVIGKARDLGINMIDTAECYGDHLSESLVGQAIHRDRDRWVVATKFGHKFNKFLERDRQWRPEEVRRQLEDSLRALRTDYIDLYQFHSPGDDEYAEGIWEMLDAQRDAGKIRHIGLSLTNNEKMDLTGQTRNLTARGGGAVQVVYNRLERNPESAIFPLCKKENIGVLARVPLASGFLSGKYKPGDRFPANDVRGNRYVEQIDATLRTVHEIAAKEVPHGVPIAQWALAWCLLHPAVSCVIPGCKNPEQVAGNAAAADLDMVDINHPQAIA